MIFLNFFQTGKLGQFINTLRWEKLDIYKDYINKLLDFILDIVYLNLDENYYYINWQFKGYLWMIFSSLLMMFTLLFLIEWLI